MPVNQMPPMMGGKPGMGGPPPDPVEANRSIFNGTDAAVMKTQGAIGPQMTVGDLITKVLKVPLDAPAGALVDAIQKQAQNANPIAKMQNIAGAAGAPPGSQMPPPGMGGGMGAPPTPPPDFKSFAGGLG